MGCAASYAEQYAEEAVVSAAAVAKLTRNVFLAGVVPLMAVRHGGAAGASSFAAALPTFVLGFVRRPRGDEVVARRRRLGASSSWRVVGAPATLSFSSRGVAVTRSRRRRDASRPTRLRPRRNLRRSAPPASDRWATRSAPPADAPSASSPRTNGRRMRIGSAASSARKSCWRRASRASGFRLTRRRSDPQASDRSRSARRARRSWEASGSRCRSRCRARRGRGSKYVQVNSGCYAERRNPGQRLGHSYSTVYSPMNYPGPGGWTAAKGN